MSELNSGKNEGKNEEKSEREKEYNVLREDFGNEGFDTLMEGVDAIIDVTDKFGMPYKDVQARIKDDYEKGLIREKDGIIMGFEKIKREKEN